MNRLKFLREERDLTQHDIGKVLGITSQAVGLYENEKRDIPNEYLGLLADFFNVTIDFLLGKSDVRNPETDFSFAYSKDTQGLSQDEVREAIEFYKFIKEKEKDKKKNK